MASAAEPLETTLTRHEIYSLAALCFTHVFTKMDTFAVPGIYVRATRYFVIEAAAQRQLLVIVPLSMHVLSALFFGYLADRKSRRILVIACLIMAALLSFGSSFADSYFVLILTRSLSYMANAGFLTMAPTLVADIASVRSTRTIALACYYIGLSVGSGLGYWISRAIAAYTDAWWWSLRFAPGWIIFGAVLLLFADFPGQGVKAAKELGGVPIAATTYLEDIKYLLRNMSFKLMLAGFTCVCFVHGALSWWIVLCMETNLPCSALRELFFTVASISGVVGIIIGTCLSLHFRSTHPAADPVICSVGLIWSVPFLLIELFGPSSNVVFRFVLLFLGQTGILLNWSLVADILLYTVVPTRRAAAISFQILTSRLFGYCASAFVLEMLFSAYHHVNLSGDGNWLHLWRTADDPEHFVKTSALQRTMLTITLVQIAGAIFFLLGHHHVIKDMEAAKQLSIMPKD